MKRIPFRFCLLFLPFVLVACVAVPPVDVSRQMLWDRFGQQSVDNVLLAWGPPEAETRLTNGSRMMTYSRSVLYLGGPWGGSASGCKASFLAPPPDFNVGNVSLDGDAYHCHELALGRTGTSVIAPPPDPYWPHRRYYPY